MPKALIALCVMATLLAPSFATAAVSGPFTTTTPITNELTDWGTLPPDPNTAVFPIDWGVGKPLTFPKFNTSQGILTQVQLHLSGSLHTVLTITNNSDEGSSGTGKTELKMSAEDALMSFLADEPLIDMNSALFPYALAAHSSISSGPLDETGTYDFTSSAPAVLAEFSNNGPATISLNAVTFTQTWLTNNGGNTSASQVTRADLTGTVTYTYDVPEPASLSLLGLGALALLRRRCR